MLLDVYDSLENLATMGATSSTEIHLSYINLHDKFPTIRVVIDISLTLTAVLLELFIE